MAIEVIEFLHFSLEDHVSISSILQSYIKNLQDGGMQMLWAAEIQARQFGCATGPDPFEQAQLPLLATMQFDGFMHKGWGMMGMGILMGMIRKKS